MTVSSGIKKIWHTNMEVNSLACPKKFVPLVESNELASSVTKRLVYETLKPLVGKVDTLVLGYPVSLLKPNQFQDVKLIDEWGRVCSGIFPFY